LRSSENGIYDAAGNTTGYGSKSYTFNQRGRMSSANVGGATYYVYNALGQLIEKIAMMPKRFARRLLVRTCALLQ
jgi:hypothetical protein